MVETRGTNINEYKWNAIVDALDKIWYPSNKDSRSRETVWCNGKKIQKWSVQVIKIQGIPWEDSYYSFTEVIQTFESLTDVYWAPTMSKALCYIL